MSRTDNKYTQAAHDISDGLLRGAGSIGSTLLMPIDYAAHKFGVHNDYIGRFDRRRMIDEGLRTLGADPDSDLYGAAKFGAEIAGTAGVGGAMAKVFPAGSVLANALATGGLDATAGNLATRIGAGAATGAAGIGLVDPGDYRDIVEALLNQMKSKR